AERPVAAPPPGDRAQRKAFVADLLAVPPHPGRDHDFETSVARRPGDRQAVRAEIPVLGHQEEDLWPACAGRGRERRRRQGGTEWLGIGQWIGPALLCDARLSNAIAVRSLAQSGAGNLEP